jgi:hypothetical protein
LLVKLTEERAAIIIGTEVGQIFFPNSGTLFKIKMKKNAAER